MYGRISGFAAINGTSRGNMHNQSATAAILPQIIHRKGEKATK
jgi:hypothetical protein